MSLSYPYPLFPLSLFGAADLEKASASSPVDSPCRIRRRAPWRSHPICGPNTKKNPQKKRPAPKQKNKQREHPTEKENKRERTRQGRSTTRLAGLAESTVLSH